VTVVACACCALISAAAGLVSFFVSLERTTGGGDEMAPLYAAGCLMLVAVALAGVAWRLPSSGGVHRLGATVFVVAVVSAGAVVAILGLFLLALTQDP
jgi:hypothetical protein